ncbi:hypothetical protein [Nonomuraea sp. NEAU-A123]|uniref:hypothetical protein n=1 Tax=Nonomuraea sp. NEAU-A123 TaxID=2839649 RepID=UPI001BE49CE9|nr:hypothetical protein [Nonomuraea sp. NEAU-A123]
MRVGVAREVARRWVAEVGAGLPGFGGAFLTGSVLWSPEDAVVAGSSDVDVMVVLDVAEPPVKPGKMRYGGVLLEISFMSAERLASAEGVLGDYHLAGSFHLPGVLADPSGRLAALHEVVVREFADRRRVLQRCGAVMDGVRRAIAAMDEAAPMADQVTSWLFGTGVTTHVLLVAGLRNPTVRRRYEAVRELLAVRGMLDHHEALLELLGCAGMGAARVERHLGVLEKVFDAAKDVRVPSYPFSSDISEAARPLSIDGSRELIARELPREAVFWLVATYARCLKKLSLAGVSGEVYEEGFRELLADLGAETFAGRRRRGERVLDALPDLWHTAETLAPA